MVSEKASDFDGKRQIDIFGGHAETQGIPMVFGGSQEAACLHVCSAWDAPYLAHSLIERGVICAHLGAALPSRWR